MSNVARPRVIVYSVAGIHLFVPPFKAIAQDISLENSDIRQIILMNFCTSSISLMEIKQIEKVLEENIFEVYLSILWQNSRRELVRVSAVEQFKQLTRCCDLNKPKSKLQTDNKVLPHRGRVYIFLRGIKRLIRRMIIGNFVSKLIKKFISFGILVNRGKHSYQLYAKFFKENLPDFAVFGSDQGETENLIQIKILERMHVSVGVLSVCDIEEIRPELKRNHFISNIFSLIPGMYGRLLPAVYWSGNIIGTFSKNATIFATSRYMLESIRQKANLPTNRVEAVKLPVSHADLKEVIRLKNFIDYNENDRIVTYFSENLAAIYGIEYDQILYPKLKIEFDKLIAQGIKVCIKLHPHESEATEKIIKENFFTQGYFISRDINYLAFVDVTNFSVAHFSRVLHECVYRHKPIISLCLLQDQNSFIPDHLSNDFVVRDCELLSLKISDYFREPKVKVRYFEKTKELEKYLSGDIENKFSNVLLKIVQN